MKLLFGVICIIGGLTGVAIGFLSNIVVTSSLEIINGLELSMWIGLFSIFVFISGVINLFSTN